MKYLTTLIFLITSAFSYAQSDLPLDTVTQKVTFTEVVQTKGTKLDLYTKALEYLALQFRSTNDAIQLKDPEAGKIICKWNILPDGARMGTVSCNLTMMFKDGRYKYTVTDFYYNGTSEFKPWAFEDNPSAFSVNMMGYARKKIKKNTGSEVSSFLYNLKSAMEKAIKADDF